MSNNNPPSDFDFDLDDIPPNKTLPQPARDPRVTTGSLPVVNPEPTATSSQQIPPIRASYGGYQYQQQPKRRSGCGCWVTGIISLFIAGALIVAGLFLPPISLYDRFFGPQYATLDTQSNATGRDGFTLAVYDPNFTGGYEVALNSTPLDTFVNASTGAEPWIAAASASAPPGLALQSPVYSITTQGTRPSEVTLSLEIPPSVGSYDLLDLYGYEDDTGLWSFIPADISGNQMVSTLRQAPDRVAIFQAEPPNQPRVLVAVDIAQRLSAEAAQLATIVAPAGLQPTLQGTLTGSLAPGFELDASYLVMPSIRNFSDARATDPGTVAAVIANSGLRSSHAAQVAAFASTGYDGVIIDYRDLPEDQRANFTAFVRDVSLNLQGTGLLLGVVVPPARNEAGAWMTGAYDWQAIGQVVDVFQINLPLDPTLYAPGDDRFIEAMLRYAISEVSRAKIITGISALSVRQVGGDFTPITFDQALSALGDVELGADFTPAGTLPPGSLLEARLDGFRAAPGTDSATGLPYVDYMSGDGTQAARMWLTDGDSLRYRMDRTIPFALSGVGFNDLLTPGVVDGIYATILNYKLGLPATREGVELALRWTIESADGVIGEVTTGLNENLVATIEAPDGNYAVNVAVVGGESTSRRGGAAVAVFAPTLTPTPPPTPTPTPTPEPTSTPARVAVAPPAGGTTGGGGNAPAMAPGAGSIAVGNFEYGGHVTSTGSSVAANAMRSAGMNWMKVQLRFGPGMGPGAAADAINNARAQGFRVLLGIVGNPNDVAAGGTGYFDQFASFVGGVAGLGPDAIEVWNEPNIDREWPAGQISGGFYTELLRRSYQAIKGANSGVMVISGAPAPTGAEAAFPGRVVNDDTFIRQMVDAGAVNYMDCLGAHYNEGVVGPSQMSGDPRDNYYTRYFRGMLDTYWNLIGGARPICFTELGYLTPEGYPPLDPFFAWGANTTVAQQAAWLAEAAAISSQSGRVRLMIVWNVDFSFYGADPQAGFAMIRPGGGCPACSAMAGAR